MIILSLGTHTENYGSADFPFFLSCLIKGKVIWPFNMPKHII